MFILTEKEAVMRSYIYDAQKYKRYLEVTKTGRFESETERCWLKGHKPYVIRYIDLLRSYSLIPFPQDEKVFKMIAEMFAWNITDGNLLPTRVSFYGQPTEIEALDLEIKRILKIKANSEFRDGVQWLYLYCTSLANFLYALGCPMGDKTLQPWTLPTWIMNAPRRILRSFLQVVCGCEARKLSTLYQRETFEVIDMVQHKETSVIDSGIKLMRQFKRLFARFGVTSSVKVGSRVKIRKKDGRKTQPICLVIHNNAENIKCFMDSIGYDKYHSKKRRESLRIFEKYYPRIRKIGKYDKEEKKERVLRTLKDFGGQIRSINDLSHKTNITETHLRVSILPELEREGNIEIKRTKPGKPYRVSLRAD